VNPRSIGVRLTAWYALILVLTFAVTGVGLWLTIRDSIHDRVDEDLRSRVAALRTALANDHATQGAASLNEQLKEAIGLTPGLQVRIAERGRSIGQWPAGGSWSVPPPDPARLAADGATHTRLLSGRPVRFLAAPLSVGGRLWSVEIGTPIDELYETLDEFTWSVLIASPLVLLLASAGGYWVSRRALAPVARITRMAQAIGTHNLAGRLPLRGVDDELDRLSDTLNGMFARLDDAFRRVTEFSADASHELRTPLAIIRTTAEVTRGRPRTEAEYAAALDRILAESERTSQVIDDLLMLARADADADRMVMEPMDLAETVREACDQGRILADASSVRFRADLPPACPAVGEAQALRRLFLILVDNAVKYTPAGGAVNVAMTAEGGGATIEVRDTGVGIPAADVPRIFERFYRVATDRSRQTGGVGLGLAIARWIASCHGGTIAVESQPGAGSVFRVTLPIVAA
jgi:two-component system, OmpR family, heavy metal sensor histidine kinase CusS